MLLAKEQVNWVVEGCIGFGLPRDPTQISRERAVLPLLRAGLGEWAVSKFRGRPAGNGGFGVY